MLVSRMSTQNEGQNRISKVGAAPAVQTETGEAPVVPFLGGVGGALCPRKDEKINNDSAYHFLNQRLV